MCAISSSFCSYATSILVTNPFTSTSHCRTTTPRCLLYLLQWCLAGSCASPRAQSRGLSGCKHNERELRQVDLVDLMEELLPCAEIHRRPFLCVELIQCKVIVKRPVESHWRELFALEQRGIVGVIDKSPRPLRNIIPAQHGSRGR
jgi:hypothetical protein